MKARVVLLCSFISIVPAAAIQACGGSSKVEGQPAGDSGAAHVVDGSLDAKTDNTADAEGPSCDTSADFTKEIPDASIADGASSTGECLACTNAHCESAVAECNKNCLCQSVAGPALDCFLKNPTNLFLACGSKLGAAIGDPDARNAAGAIFTCVQSHCKTECALDALLPHDGGDGG
jgi:hypothetical protein